MRLIFGQNNNNKIIIIIKNTSLRKSITSVKFIEKGFFGGYFENSTKMVS